MMRSQASRLSHWGLMLSALIIGFTVLIPVSGYALRDAPTPWLRELCVTSMQPARLESLFIRPNSTTLDIGQRENFEARGLFSDGSTQDITDQADWTSSSESVGTIDSQGRFTAEGPGRTTIQATVDDISGTASVTVRSAQLESISVRPGSATLDIGEHENFEARGTFSDGSTQDLTDQANWTSSNERVGTINNQGRFTAERAGSTTVRATVDGESDTASVRVRTPPDTCRDLFGDAPGFRLCNETSNTCSFNANTNGGTCDQMCRRFGSRCVDAFDNEGSSCSPISGSNDTCQTRRQTEICVCER